MTNYCTRCACFYEKPGSCNCFAPTIPQIQPFKLTTYPPMKPGTLTPYVCPPLTGGSTTGITLNQFEQVVQ